MEPTQFAPSHAPQERWPFLRTLALAVAPWLALQLAFHFFFWGPAIGPISALQVVALAGALLSIVTSTLAFSRLRSSLAYALPLVISLAFITWSAMLLGAIPFPGDDAPHPDPVTRPARATPAPR